MAKSNIVLLLLSFFALTAHSKVFESIDCGSSTDFTDDNSIPWTGDDNIVKTGQSKIVESSDDVIDVVMKTLRVFTSGEKNCYSIAVEKGGTILVRASFLYGNYDNKLSPPAFDLYFDGNLWANVETSSRQTMYYEVVCVAKSNTINVCLAQTHPGQFPFISGLEVRSLDSDMYDLAGSNHALVLKRRVAYGADSIIRYSDDTYDRMWLPVRPVAEYTAVTSDATSIDTNKGNKPPKAVMINAVTTILTDKIALTDTYPSQEVPIYAILYFSEVQELNPTQKRSFVLYKDSKAISDPISPPYGRVFQLPVYTTASSKTIFYLIATSDSTLPPLINAVEVYYVTPPLTGEKNSKDGSLTGATDNKYGSPTGGTNNKDGKPPITESEGSSLGYTPSGSKKKSSNLPVIIGSVAAVITVFIAVGC